MKKIFTFVLGAFMALSASAEAIHISFTEGVNFEDGEEEGGRYYWKFTGDDASYFASIYYSAAEAKLEGIYTVGDLIESLTYVMDKQTNRIIVFNRGTVQVERGEADTLHLHATVVGRYEDENTTNNYVIDLYYAPKAAEGLPGDEDSEFLMNFESYTIDDELADEGMVYVEALDENRNYVVLEVSLPENATQLVAGTYEVAVVEDEDYPYQSVTAGSYQYGEPQPSFASVLAEDGETIEKVWYIVYGKVFVKENMDIAIAANNSLGKRLAIVLHGNSQAAIEMTSVATAPAIKIIENGMIVIEHNGVRSNVIGQVVR